MINSTTLKKWLLYVGIILFCTAIGGDFGTLAGLFLIFMIHKPEI